MLLVSVELTSKACYEAAYQAGSIRVYDVQVIIPHIFERQQIVLASNSFEYYTY